MKTSLPLAAESLAVPGGDDSMKKSGNYEGGKVVQATPSVVEKDILVSTANLKDGDEALELLAKLGYDVHDLPRLASTFDEAYYKRLTWKIDLTVLPILAFTYLLQFLDKNVRLMNLSYYLLYDC
jgi:hypothetical protein